MDDEYKTIGSFVDNDRIVQRYAKGERLGHIDSCPGCKGQTCPLSEELLSVLNVMSSLLPPPSVPDSLETLALEEDDTLYEQEAEPDKDLSVVVKRWLLQIRSNVNSSRRELVR